MRLVLTEGKHLKIKHIYYSEVLNVWIKDFNDKDIINIKCDNKELKLFSNRKYRLIANQQDKDTIIDSIVLSTNKKYYLLNIEENKILILYVEEDYDKNFKIFKIDDSCTKFSIAGKYFVDADILINDTEYDYSQIVLTKNYNNYILEIKDLPSSIYNGNYVQENNIVKYGDYLFINGMTIVLINDLLFVYNHNDSLKASKNTIREIKQDILNYEASVVDNDYYEKNSLINFKRVPKIQRRIERKVFAIDGPGSQELKESMPMIYTLLPMMMMSMTSVISAVNVINDVTMKKKSLSESMPSLIVTACMILAMVAFPIVSGIYRKRRESKREIKRIEEYKDYIYEQKRKINEEIEFQKEILNNSFYDTEKSKEIIETVNNLLWERKRGNEDFLTFSLGKGDIPPIIDIKIPEEHFSIDKDKLRIQLVKLEEETEKIKDVPIAYSFSSNFVTSFIGKEEIIKQYIESFLIRVFATCTHDDVKIIVFTNSQNKPFWERYKDTPYLWNEDQTLRFLGSDNASYSRIINFLDEEYNNRKTGNIESEEVTSNVQSYTNYFIFVDDISRIKNVQILNEIIKSNTYYGFSVILNTSKMDLLPSECKNFIYINDDNGKLVSNVNKNYIEVDFKLDILNSDYTICYQTLSNIYLDSFDKKFILPTKYGFLEMYEVGNIETLDIVGKWNNNSTVDSIAAPIGIDDNGEKISLNLHENSHGPHGLVAGMTGSGKSELLITYILSLAVSFNPLEVQFVLIDYKGGGLANTFYNSNIGMILPHVVGVITNINENEINRSLISLQSEVKRRQKVFADVSIKYNEGNMDIYKYEKIYRANNDVECLSHLFIISDEFAELKTQNPEFINQLISIARIGRSLGIHLILATQKPSGIVDDQIWSNSRFKICLKVQDKNDLNDMIKMPNAPMLKEAGRFYLQVGFNELFLKGQSAYSGVEYIEKESINSSLDDKIDFLNDYGKKYLSLALVEEQIKKGKGKEIKNIVETIIELAKQQNYNIRGLWRELIPEKIYYNELIQKYEFSKTEKRTCILGEYDAPDKQTKGLATINLVGTGNIIIYGIIGSGKEMLLQLMLYSLICNYSTEEINIYIMDFGAEILGNYMNSPQVGDIIYLSEKEKVINSFKYLDSLIETRKKEFVNYNGDFVTYNQKSSKKLPVVLFVINILENLFENYEELSEQFLQITRECNRYGIAILSTTNGTTNVRNKLLQGFKQSIVLELKDKYEYTNLFGSKVNINPAKYKGRGLVDMGGIYEFQTANLNHEIDNNTAIDMVNEKLKTVCTNAIPIPVLPTVVSFEIIKRFLTDSTKLPLGINTDDLSTVKLLFQSKRGTLITGLEIDILMNFYESLEKNILSFQNNKLFIFNSTKAYKNTNNNNTVINDNYETYLKQLSDYAKNNNNPKTINYINFVGIYDIFNSLSAEYKKEFSQLLKTLNSLDNFCLLFIDGANNIKKLEFEEFYRTNVNNSRGVWVGNGISDQMIIKFGRIPREYRETTTDLFGFVIENGIVTKIKLLNYIGGNNEE